MLRCGVLYSQVPIYTKRCSACSPTFNYYIGFIIMFPQACRLDLSLSFLLYILVFLFSGWTYIRARETINVIYAILWWLYVFLFVDIQITADVLERILPKHEINTLVAIHISVRISYISTFCDTYRNKST